MTINNVYNMKIRAFLIFLLGVGLQSYAMTKETQEIFDSISAIEYESSYPFVYKSIDEETGTEIEIVVSDGSDFLSRPVDKRFWIYDYKTGKYWKKADKDFDLNFGLYYLNFHYLLILFYFDLIVFYIIIYFYSILYYCFYCLMLIPVVHLFFFL